jgi:uncharacterized membrane protein YoaK (UPF0700 family)
MPPELLLLLCLTFVAGMVDAISFLGLGGVFTANMTGNIVLLGLAAGRASGSGVLRSAVSLIAFVTGVFAASRMTGRVRTARSWPAGFRTALGVEVVAQSAFLVGWLACSGRPGTALGAVLVGILALAMGIQSGAVGALGFGGISTTYMTGTMTGLLGELATSTGSRQDRARRTLVVAALPVGAACSVPLLLIARRAAPALPLAVTLLALAATVYLPAPASDRDRSDGPP